MATVLVVDDDTDIARFIEINLRLEGFDVRVAHDGEQAEQSIDEETPDLVLLDVMMPKVDGVELCRRLRANPATANLPVIMLTAKSLSADKVVGLTAGADDYIIKPFDTLELVARVRSTLRRNAEMRAVSPLTGLPGNHRIEEELADRVTKAEPFAVLYLDLDNFKAFNDCYGFLRGDEVITLLATAARRAVMEAGEPAPFVGHIGGDDFVVVCLPEQAEPLAKRVVDVFDSSAPRLHDPEDTNRGYIEVTDRQGKARRFPLVSVSIGVAMSGNRMFADKREVVDVATEMKKVAKATVGSSVAVDRRGTPPMPEHPAD
ncbi:MAG TPA: response regulator [Frankiaceae bacterium]|jgi:diguanylate cyclase (GGDEF)-like protein|nr:response regulator [Frankiaceae bacterium]